MKQNLPNINNESYSVSECSKYTLFGGTTVIQIRPVGDQPVTALVTNTGFLTTKGSLVRDILYPKQINFKFQADAMKFVLLMACIAVLGFVLLLRSFILMGIEPAIFIDRFLNLIVICVPPALPAAMSCGVAFAIFRLKNQRIFCISPPRVNLSGRITTFVFDKTGTLTEDGLSVQGFRCVKASDNKIAFKDFYTDVKELNPPLAKWWETKQAKDFRSLHSTLFLESLACCCGVTYVNGSLIGDPLDVKMFQSTGWILDEAQTSPSLDNTINNEAVEIVATLYPPELQQSSSYSNASSRSESSQSYVSELVRRFDFSSALQRMSVICRNQIDKQFLAFVKGSPEKIQELCDPSTLPTNYEEVLEVYTKEGFRVIALATKPLPEMTYKLAMGVHRKDVESSLTFLGLLIMENKLKKETPGTIENLQKCKVKTVMATGDNVLTAISVAR